MPAATVAEVVAPCGGAAMYAAGRPNGADAHPDVNCRDAPARARSRAMSTAPSFEFTLNGELVRVTGEDRKSVV